MKEFKRMPRFEAHCAESLRIFGSPFDKVHLWLDEYAGSTEYGFRHRKKRHHEAGIREAAVLFGEGAAAAARTHILADLKEEGWTETYRFPQDEADYLRMGLY